MNNVISYNNIRDFKKGVTVQEFLSDRHLMGGGSKVKVPPSSLGRLKYIDVYTVRMIATLCY